jgi:hypothetical protein
MTVEIIKNAAEQLSEVGSSGVWGTVRISRFRTSFFEFLTARGTKKMNNTTL